MSILDELEITIEQLTEAVNANPSLFGMLFGYIAEMKLKQIIQAIPGVTLVTKHDDHDRKKKGDLYVIYRNKAFTVESKSLQSKTIAFDEQAGIWTGKVNVDASDRREVTLPSGEQLNTTLLLRGEFDILAVNCFRFGNEWRFVYTRNRDLPFSSYSRYSEEQRKSLIASLIPVTWPPSSPFYTDLQKLLDEMVEEGLGQNPDYL